jgi:CheY-like chemotaxis protein
MRVAVAIGCVLVSAAAGCSSRSLASTPASASAVAPLPAISAIQDEPIPGIGATRAAWDASHTPNAASNDGSDYGDDSSLPSYLTPSGAVYSGVTDQGTGRIQFYDLNMPTVDGVEALRRVRKELPSDATAAWDLPLDQCYRRAFNSPTLQAAGHYMADVQLEYIQEDGSRRSGPDSFNHAWIWLDKAGSPPNSETDCSMWAS